MDLKNSVGSIFSETAFFDQVQFEVEANLDRYLGKDWHLFFKRIPDGNIQITEVVEYTDRDQLDPANKASFFVKEWIFLRGKTKSVSVQLCRLDRSGRLASVYSDYTRIQETGVSYAEEYAHLPRLTAEEKRQAFMELAGIFDDQLEAQKSREKKAV